MSRKKNRRNRQLAAKQPGNASPAPRTIHRDTSRPGNEYDAAAGPKGYYGRIVSALRAAVPGGWASDHYEETLHCTGWNYIAANSIGMQCAAAGIEVSRPIDSIDAWSGKTYRKRFDRLHKHSGRERYFQSVRSRGRFSALKSHDQGDSEERDILPEDFGLCKLINRPNPSQSGAHLRYEASIQLSQTGTALIVKIPNKFGKAVELYVVPTCLMTPRPPTSEFPYGAYYVSPAATRTNWADDSFVTMVGYQRLAGLTLDMRDLVKISFPHPLWKDEGYSALAACSLWTDASEQIDRARFSQFMNGCDPSMILEPPEDVNPTDNEIERVLQKMMEFIGTKHTGRVLVTPGGTKATPWSTTPREMAYGEGFDQLRNAIMGGHGVPLIAAGITDGGSYAAFYAALKQFIMLCVQPRLDWIAEELTYQLAEQYGEGLMIRFLAQSVDDPSILEARLATDVNARAITKNEIRQLRGLEPKEDGDVWAGERVSETVRADAQAPQSTVTELAGTTDTGDERSTGIATGQTRPANPGAHFDSIGNSNIPSIGPFDMGGKSHSPGFNRLAEAASMLWNGQSKGVNYP